MAFAIFAVAATAVLIALLAARPTPRRIPVRIRDSRRPPR
jgi:hypothetical protein